MLCALKFSNNGRSFKIGHWWHDKSLASAERMDQLHQLVMEAVANFGIPVRIVVADGEHKQLRDGPYHATTLMQLRKEISADCVLIHARIKEMVAAKVPDSKGRHVWNRAPRTKRGRPRRFTPVCWRFRHRARRAAAPAGAPAAWDQSHAAA